MTDRKALVDSLEIAGMALATIDMIPVQKCFRFRDGVLTAYNDAVAVSVEVDVEGEFIVEGKVLLGLLTNTTSKDVTFEVDNEDLLIKAARSTFRLPVRDPAEFLFVAPKEPAATVIAYDFDFYTGLTLCAKTVSKSDTQRPLNGIYFKKGSLYSSDGDAISRYDLTGHKVNDSFLLPNQFCDILCAVTDTGLDKAELTLSKEWMTAEFEAVTVHGRPLNVDHIDLSVELKKTIKGAQEFVPLPDGLTQALNRSCVVTAYETVPTKLVVSKNRLKLHTKTSIGEVADSVAFPDHLDVEASVSAELFKQCLGDAIDKVLLTSEYCAFKGPKLFVALGNME